MNIKIAIIGIGISNMFDKNINIKHFYIDNNHIVEGYKEPFNPDGSFLFKGNFKAKC